MLFSILLKVDCWYYTGHFTLHLYTPYGIPTSSNFRTPYNILCVHSSQFTVSKLLRRMEWFGQRLLMKDFYICKLYFRTNCGCKVILYSLGMQKKDYCFSFFFVFLQKKRNFNTVKSFVPLNFGDQQIHVPSEARQRPERVIKGNCINSGFEPRVICLASRRSTPQLIQLISTSRWLI